MAKTSIITALLVGFALLCYIPYSSSNSSRNIDPELQEKIDEFITNVYLPATGLTSLGMALVKDDGDILYTTGFGYADHENKILNGNDTQFSIGSITKSFTSTAAVKTMVEKLTELGEGALDVPLHKLFPQVNITFIDRFRSEYMTFRDLLSHRACLFTHDLPLGSEPFETLEELVYRSRYSEEVCSIRSDFQYNNVMYVLAGQLLGILWETSYDEVMQDLLADLGMDNTAFIKRSDDFSNMPDRANPYYVMDGESHLMNFDLMKRVIPFRPAGGVFSTPNDMARYMRFHLNLGSLDGKQIVSEEALEWMRKPSIVFPYVAAYKESEDEIAIISQGGGLGLALMSYDGWPYLNHGGTFTPYVSYMSLFPAQKLGIFTTTNQGPNQIFDDVLHYFIFETLRGNQNARKQAEAMIEKTKQDKKLGVLRQEETIKALKKGLTGNAEEIVGKYGNGAAGDIDISEKWNDITNSTGIYFSYGKWMLGWMEAIGDNLYKIKWDTDIVQHLYAVGDREGVNFVKIENEVVDFLVPQAGGDLGSAGRFMLGVSLDKLPPIPWNPGSCGPEEMFTQVFDK